jgi:hypothetical protein
VEQSGSAAAPTSTHSSGALRTRGSPISGSFPGMITVVGAVILGAWATI